MRILDKAVSPSELNNQITKLPIAKTLELSLHPFNTILELQRSFRSHIGVKEIEKPTYHVTEPIRRFNQKKTIISRRYFDPNIMDLFQKSKTNRSALAKKGIPGFTLIDRSLADATMTIPESWDWDVIYPNLGFLSWTPLKEPTYEKLNLKRFECDDEQKMTRLIKKTSLWFGASLVRITTLDRRWVYSHWYDYLASPPRNPQIMFSDEFDYQHYDRPSQLKDGTQIIPKEMKYVIMLAFEMDYEAMKTAPSAIAQAGSYMYGYRKIIQTIATLAAFIRGLGYNAIPSSNDTALNVPLAINAGIGEDARAGWLITPEYGPRVRLAKVITDLPLTTDHPITFGIHQFCDLCKKCARMCPSIAIPNGPRTTGFEKNDVDSPTPSESTGSLRWIRNAERCYSYLSAVGTDCGICIRVCPWNKPDGRIHSITKWFAIKGGSKIKRAIIKFDDKFGYGKPMKPEEWWNENS